MHANVIQNILQPTEQTLASKVKQLLKGLFRKKLPVRVWAGTSGCEGGPRPTACKPSVLNYTHLSLNKVMILALTTVKRLSDTNLLKITQGAMQKIGGLSYLQTTV